MVCYSSRDCIKLVKPSAILLLPQVKLAAVVGSSGQGHQPGSEAIRAGSTSSGRSAGGGKSLQPVLQSLHSAAFQSMLKLGRVLQACPALAHGAAHAVDPMLKVRGPGLLSYVSMRDQYGKLVLQALYQLYMWCHIYNGLLSRTMCAGDAMVLTTTNLLWLLTFQPHVMQSMNSCMCPWLTSPLCT